MRGKNEKFIKMKKMLLKRWTIEIETKIAFFSSLSPALISYRQIPFLNWIAVLVIKKRTKKKWIEKNKDIKKVFFYRKCSKLNRSNEKNLDIYSMECKT